MILFGQKWVIVLVALFVMIGVAKAQEAEMSTICHVLRGHDKHAADYQAGVDVNGNAVASADLNQNINNDFDVIEIPVEINLAERFNIDVDGGLKLEPTVTNFKIHQDGRVMYGEQDLSGQAKALCGISHKVEQEDVLEVTPAEEVDVKSE